MREINRKIGARLRKMRKAKRMKQGEVAEALKISLSAYTKLENGDRGLTSENCIALAKLFDTSCDLILKGTEANMDAGIIAEKLDRLLQLTGMAKLLADEIYDDALVMKLDHR